MSSRDLEVRANFYMKITKLWGIKVYGRNTTQSSATALQLKLCYSDFLLFAVDLFFFCISTTYSMWSEHFK